MTSRDVILAALRRNAPPPEPLPEPVHHAYPDGCIRAAFVAAVEAAGGQVRTVTPGGVPPALADRFPSEANVIAAVALPGAGLPTLETPADVAELASIEVLVCRGSLGVAENGAVWLSESQMGHRAAPFLAQHLILLLDAGYLVWNLHEAYDRLAPEAEGFGAFIAGPSKTADIEQSLVIGAHGPRSLTVLLEEAGRSGDGTA